MTKLRIEKKRLNIEIKKYNKCLKSFKKDNAHPINIECVQSHLTYLLTKKDNL